MTHAPASLALNDLELDLLAAPARLAARSGKSGKVLDFSVLGPVEPQHLALLTSGVGSKPPALVRLRSSHHEMARLLARGARPAEVSIITGYSNSRISILQADPAFQDLMAHYAGQVAEVAADVTRRMGALSLDAIEELQRRVDEEPELIGTETLLKIGSAMLDRTGHGPQSSSKVTVTTLGAAELLALKQAAAEGCIIDVSPSACTPVEVLSHEPQNHLTPARSATDLGLSESGLGESDEEAQGSEQVGDLL